MVWEGFWLVGPPVGVGVEDRRAYLIWGGIALVLAVAQAFIASQIRIHHLQTALHDKKRRRAAREAVGRVQERLADLEGRAYNGTDGTEYDKVLKVIEEIKTEVHRIGREDLEDDSFLSRFLAVNVLDTPLDDATKMHFISRAQGSFWTVYQQVKGWRIFVREFMKEITP